MRRPYRKKNERPEPELPSSNEANYTRKSIKARVPEHLIRAMTHFAKVNGRIREDCVEEALIEFLDSRSPGFLKDFE